MDTEFSSNDAISLLRHAREHITKAMHSIDVDNPAFQDLSEAKSHTLVINAFLQAIDDKAVKMPIDYRNLQPCNCNGVPHSETCPKYDNGSTTTDLCPQCNGKGRNLLHADDEFADPCQRCHGAGTVPTGGEADHRHNNQFEAMEESEIQRIVTLAVREADHALEESGGSSRHWVRDWFLPYLRQKSLEIVRVVETFVPVEHGPTTNYAEQMDFVRKSMQGGGVVLDDSKMEPVPQEPPPTINDVTVTIQTSDGNVFTFLADNLKIETSRAVTKQCDNPGSKKFKLTPSRRVETKILVTDAEIYAASSLDGVIKDWKGLEAIKKGADAHRDVQAKRVQNDEL